MVRVLWYQTPTYFTLIIGMLREDFEFSNFSFEEYSQLRYSYRLQDRIESAVGNRLAQWPSLVRKREG